MERLGAILLITLLVGCAGQPTIVKEIRVQEVKVPVIIRPSPPPKLERPALPIEQLTSGVPPGVVVQKYKATVKILQGYIKELEQILDGYRDQPKDGAVTFGVEPEIINK